MALLLTLGSFVFILPPVHSTWPLIVRKSHCPWCWKTFHLMQWYPRYWSSTICRRHARQVRAQSAACRARRPARAEAVVGMPPVQVEEVLA
jgi:hypothetical protein